MKRVLVVDDKEENRYYLEALLRGSGFSVEVASHGAEALVKARQSPPDVAISDLLMPVMDGYTLLRHWKADARLKRAPFVVYTATYTEEEDEKLAYALGADAFVLKPAEPEDILSRLRAALEATATAPPAEPFASGGDPGILKTYSETLIRKLEEKTIQLEEANRALERDIAERKAVEAALRTREQEFRTLAEAMPQIVWISGADGANVYLNRLWTEYTGLSAEEGRGYGWLKAMHPEDRPLAERAWRGAVADGGTYSVECRLRGAGGAYRWWLMRGLPLRDAAGAIERWFGTCTDVHDLKETQEQLRQAQRLEIVGQLTGGVAHDFNNILAVILANVEALEEDEQLAPSASARVAQIDGAVQRAADLIRQLLAFSRKQPLAPQRTDVNELAAGTGTMLRRALGEQIEIVSSFAEGVWPVNVDRAQLESALLNLCVNARDAMPGGGRLAIETRNVVLGPQDIAGDGDAAPGDYVRISVSDTGVGIAPENLAKVFEPFFTTKEAGKGTGLGLSMVYGFVRQSRGFVRIRSEVGRGTSVDLFLPRAEGGEPADVADAKTPSPRGSERILVVENDRQVRDGIVGHLQALGYAVVAVEDGPAGLRACADAQEPFDALLTDVVMPGGVDGRALAEEASRRWPGIRVVFVSGHPEHALVESGRIRAGGLLLAKPFHRGDLARILRRALDAPPPAVQAAAC